MSTVGSDVVPGVAAASPVESFDSITITLEYTHVHRTKLQNKPVLSTTMVSALAREDKERDRIRHNSNDAFIVHFSLIVKSAK